MTRMTDDYMEWVRRRLLDQKPHVDLNITKDLMFEMEEISEDLRELIRVLEKTVEKLCFEINAVENEIQKGWDRQ